MSQLEKYTDRSLAISRTEEPTWREQKRIANHQSRADGLFSRSAASVMVFNLFQLSYRSMEKALDHAPSYYTRDARGVTHEVPDYSNPFLIEHPQQQKISRGVNEVREGIITSAASHGVPDDQFRMSVEFITPSGETLAVDSYNPRAPLTAGSAVLRATFLPFSTTVTH
jgi:hypothetical protein